MCGEDVLGLAPFPAVDTRRMDAGSTGSGVNLKPFNQGSLAMFAWWL